MEAEEDLPHHFLQHEEGDEIVEYVDDGGHPIEGMDFVEWVEEGSNVEQKPFEHHVEEEHESYMAERQEGEVYMHEVADEEGQYYQEYQEGYEENPQEEEDIPYEDLNPEDGGYGDYDPTSSYLESGRPNVPRKLTIVECEVCGAILKHPSKIQAHMRTHTGEKPFECHLCGDRFTQKVPLSNHIRRHTGDMPFECAFCAKRFPNNAQKNAHELRHQGVRRRGPPRPHLKPPKRRVVPLPILTDTITKRHAMEEKPMAAAPNNLQMWRGGPQAFRFMQPPLSAAASKRIDDVIESVVSGADLRPKKQPLPHRSSLIAQCNYCGLMLRHPSKIKAHMRTHTGEKPFGCSVCGMRFANMYPLRMHMKRKHSTDRKLPCQFGCGKVFVSVGTRNEHEKVVHLDFTRYTCGVPGCHRTFTRRVYLMTHRAKEHPNFQPVFDPHEVNAAEELDQQIDRAVHFPQDTMMIDGDDVDRLIELPDGVILLPEGAQILEGDFIHEEEGTVEQFDPALHYLAEEPLPVDSVEGEGGHLQEEVVVQGEIGLLTPKREPKLLVEPKLEETVKHVWMNPGGGDKKRRISVRILKRR